jgi:tetratricopeptide (TPR) repeat protein
VNVQLIDAENGRHLWADRFDKPLADLFDLQDEIVAQLANMLNARLITAEASRAERTSAPDSMDFTFQGRAWFDKGRTPEIIGKARDFFEKALAVDANNSQALAGLALCHATEFGLGWPTPEVNYDSQVMGLADRAIAIDREEIPAYWAKADYLNSRCRQIEARRIVDEGLAIDPNSAPLLALRSIIGTYLGQFEQAKSDIETAMRLSPRDPSLSRWRNYLADAELGLGHLDAAIEASSRAIDGGYRVYFSYLNLAAAYALKGDMEEARKAVAEARQTYPKLSIAWLGERKPILQYAFDSLRKAGLPEA